MLIYVKLWFWILISNQIFSMLCVFSVAKQSAFICETCARAGGYLWSYQSVKLVPAQAGICGNVNLRNLWFLRTKKPTTFKVRPDKIAYSYYCTSLRADTWAKRKDNTETPPACCAYLKTGQQLTKSSPALVPLIIQSRRLPFPSIWPFCSLPFRYGHIRDICLKNRWEHYSRKTPPRNQDFHIFPLCKHFACRTLCRPSAVQSAP